MPNEYFVKLGMNFLHKKCRNIDIPYLRSQLKRTWVPDNKVSWEVEWSAYNPPDYTDPSICGKPWADLDIKEGDFKWNQRDDNVERTSYTRNYLLASDSRPMNPIGRTGLKGRGILGRWGPNHAADPLVTRYKNGVLQFVAIQRTDTGEWAIPGGMVDPGEVISETLKREFSEETLDGQNAQLIEGLWKNGTEIYKGYVDDPRNTDNAWMETTVINFHDKDGILNSIDLKAGDDAASVQWMDISDDTPLYASHKYFISLCKRNLEK